jgi:hypothetical protein
MWTTTYGISPESGMVREVVHDFGHGIFVVVDLEKNTVRRYVGCRLVKEYTADAHISYYYQFLREVDEEVAAEYTNKKKNNSKK